jgi:transposase-like protein
MDSLGARTGEQWNIDETMVTTDGNPRWVWNVVDAGTRFLLATHVTRLRRLRDAQVVVSRAKSATPDRPMEVRTDGLPAYRKAIGRELWYRCDGEVVNPHHRVRSIRAKVSNNLVERLHGTEKARIKTLRGFHGKNGPKLFMEGFRVHYNMIRIHEVLGTTPAEAAGLPSPGDFGWKGVIEASSIETHIPEGEAEIVLVTTPTREPTTSKPVDRD